MADLARDALDKKLHPSTVTADIRVPCSSSRIG